MLFRLFGTSEEPGSGFTRPGCDGPNIRYLATVDAAAAEATPAPGAQRRLNPRGARGTGSADLNGPRPSPSHHE